MNLSSFSLRRPVTTMMVLVAVIVFGIVSLTMLPLDLFPSIEVPFAIVVTNYPGAGPAEVENLVTRNLESAIGSVAGITGISSTSSAGSSVIMIEFDYGTDLNFAVLDIRESVDMVASFLPDDVGSPMVMTISMDMMPVVMTAISGGADLSEMQTTVEDDIVPMLERIDGVADVSVTGGSSRRIEVRTYPEVLKGYGISTSMISGLIGGENLSISAGNITQGNSDMGVVTTGEFDSIEQLAAMNIPLSTGGVLPLSSVADISWATVESDSLARVNGDICLGLTVTKQSGKNTVEVANAILAEIANAQELHPELEFTVVLDQAEYIEASIAAVASNILVGSLLAVVVLFVFLRSLGMTTLIAISIPSSVVTTFSLLYFLGITLNMVTLGGLALGVGMMVDNSIVVLENIYRFRTEGHKPKDAALKGASEVAMAVTASTITTIAVFLPIVFVEGITSSIFRELALTVTASLAASLFVSLTLVPILSIYLLPSDKAMEKLTKNRKEGPIMKLYRGVLKFAMNHRVLTVCIAFAIFASSLSSIAVLGAEFFPASDQGTLTVTIDMPTGSTNNEIDQMSSTIGEMIGTMPEVAYWFATTDSSMGMAGGTGGTASITVDLKPRAERERSAMDLETELRRMTADIAGAKITVSSAGTADMGAMLGSAVQISIKGTDLDELSRISREVAAIVDSVDGTTEVEAGLQEEIPEVEITMRGENASRFGLTTASVATAVRTAVSGTTATRLRLDGDEIDVVLIGEDVAESGIDGLATIEIPTPMGGNVPLELVANIEVISSPPTISRAGQVRTVSVVGNIEGRDVATANNEIAALLEDYVLPGGYTLEIEGESAEIAESFADLALALALAILLVLLVLASQFESLVLPFPIILTVPLGMSGGLWALMILGTPLSVPAFIGLIMLSGIVVNNGIVLVDYIITRRKSGEDRMTATLNAGPIRMRPVMMTTLTTILGLVPLAMGVSEGGELMAPLAISMIGGLILSTLSTLIIVPVFYSLFDDMRGKKAKEAFTEVE